eukprot:GHVQ01027441.1.p1 GENE.GHVQ01027441.1~~GHVQ01027441.1.p1  ORF type:complete len:986 (-),score=148.89 GHVQ01027441.1:2045-5002(-)
MCLHVLLFPGYGCLSVCVHLSVPILHGFYRPLFAYFLEPVCMSWLVMALQANTVWRIVFLFCLSCFGATVGCLGLIAEGVVWRFLGGEVGVGLRGEGNKSSSEDEELSDRYRGRAHQYGRRESDSLCSCNRNKGLTCLKENKEVCFCNEGLVVLATDSHTGFPTLCGPEERGDVGRRDDQQPHVVQSLPGSVAEAANPSDRRNRSDRGIRDTWLSDDIERHGHWGTENGSNEDTSAVGSRQRVSDRRYNHEDTGGSPASRDALGTEGRVHYDMDRADYIEVADGDAEDRSRSGNKRDERDATARSDGRSGDGESDFSLFDVLVRDRATELSGDSPPMLSGRTSGRRRGVFGGRAGGSSEDRSEGSGGEGSRGRGNKRARECHACESSDRTSRSRHHRNNSADNTENQGRSGREFPSRDRGRSTSVDDTASSLTESKELSSESNTGDELYVRGMEEGDRRRKGNNHSEKERREDEGMSVGEAREGRAAAGYGGENVGGEGWTTPQAGGRGREVRRVWGGGGVSSYSIGDTADKSYDEEDRDSGAWPGVIPRNNELQANNRSAEASKSNSADDRLHRKGTRTISELFGNKQKLSTSDDINNNGREKSEGEHGKRTVNGESIWWHPGMLPGLPRTPGNGMATATAPAAATTTTTTRTTTTTTTTIIPTTTTTTTLTSSSTAENITTVNTSPYVQTHIHRPLIPNPLPPITYPPLLYSSEFDTHFYPDPSRTSIPLPPHTLSSGLVASHAVQSPLTASPPSYSEATPAADSSVSVVSDGINGDVDKFSELTLNEFETSSDSSDHSILGGVTDPWGGRPLSPTDHVAPFSRYPIYSKVSADPPPPAPPAYPPSLPYLAKQAPTMKYKSKPGELSDSAYSSSPVPKSHYGISQIAKSYHPRVVRTAPVPLPYPMSLEYSSVPPYHFGRSPYEFGYSPPSTFEHSVALQPMNSGGANAARGGGKTHRNVGKILGRIEDFLDHKIQKHESAIY